MDIGFGIDGGGTRTRLILFETGSLRPLYQGEGGPSNPHSAGMAAAQDNLRQLLTAGCQALGIAPGDLACGCLGSAGLGRMQEQDAFLSFLRSLVPGPLKVCTDGEILLVGSTGRMEGYCLIAGTGSFALGRNQQGQVVRSGGLGHMLGDEGSASWIGWQAMRRALASREQRDLGTGLLPGLLAHYGLSAPEKAIPLFHQRFDKARVAASAPLVLTAALEKDPLAADILDQAARALFLLLNSVVIQQPHEARTFSLAGGLLERDNPLQSLLLKQVEAAWPQAATAIAQPRDAVQGACMLAQALIQ